MRAIRNALLAITLVVALSSCAMADAPVATEQAEPEAIEPSPSASPEPSNSPEPEPEVVPEPCSELVSNGMQQTINSQTKAFSEEEFELAYSFASPNFQNNVNLRSFVAIIAGSYGPLISSSSLSFSDCLMDPEESFGIIDVSFLQSGENVYALRYLMVDTADGWRVEGASNLEVIGKGA